MTPITSNVSAFFLSIFIFFRPCFFPDTSHSHIHSVICISIIRIDIHTTYYTSLTLSTVSIRHQIMILQSVQHIHIYICIFFRLPSLHSRLHPLSPLHITRKRSSDPLTARFTSPPSDSIAITRSLTHLSRCTVMHRRAAEIKRRAVEHDELSNLIQWGSEPFCKQWERYFRSSDGRAHDQRAASSWRGEGRRRH